MSLYRFDIFELDVNLYRLSRLGDPVAISPKAFDLLSYLLRHCNRTVSKQELIVEVWHAEAISSSSIPTCITAVRRALRDPPENPKFIETVRGRGYRFIGEVVAESEVPAGADTGTLEDRTSKTFVGRDAEMASLLKSLAEVLSGNPQAFLLLGEAGIGKTRIIEEFARLAEARGASALVGRCREEEGAPPFWPWIQILRTLVAPADRRTLAALQPFAAVVSHVLPELRTTFPEIAPLQDVNAEQARFRLLDAIASFFFALAKQRPFVLMIDDLHRADNSSLLLLEFFIRQLRASPILIVAAYRECYFPNDPKREQCLTRVARSAISRSIQLKGISRRAVSELIGEPPDAELVELLYEQSAGNPFFLTQLVQLLEVDSGALSDRSPVGRHFLLPAQVRDTIYTQLNGLPATTLETLKAAAIIGREFSPTLVSRMRGAPFFQIVEQLAPAIAARLIDNTQPDFNSYRFRHALLRDVVYTQIPALDRIRLHRQVGEALEALHACDLDSYIPELAFHFAEGAGAGDAGKAVAYCIAAGEQATAQLAHENAPEHFRTALRVMDIGEIDDPRKRCELLIRLGAAEMRAGERDLARRDLLHAANIARQIDAPELMARAALGLAPGLFTIEVGTYDPELESLLTEARAAIPKSETDLLVQLTARLAMAAVWSTTAQSCERLSATAVALAHRVANPVTKAYALRARHGVLWSPNRFDERRQLISELRDLSTSSNDAEITLMYRILNITALLEAGDIARADHEIYAYAKLAKRLQLPHAEWYVSLFSAMRSLMQGQYSEAASFGERFLAIGERVHDENASQSFAAHLLLRLWEDDRLAEILGVVEDFIAKHPMIFAWKCAAAFIYSEIRDTEGNRLLDEFCEIGFCNLPVNETWSIAVQMLSNTCVNVGSECHANSLYELLLPGKLYYTIVGYGVMSWGSRARELGNLASLMGRFDEASEHFQLAIAQNQKAGAAPWVARSQYDYARMLAKKRDRTHRGQVRELVTAARQTADRLGMVRLKRQIADFVKEI